MSAMPEMLIGQTGQPSQPGAIDFDTAVDEFLEYLTGYRNYSPATATSYRTDLRQFRRFLVDKLGRVPRLEEITREWVIQFGVRMKGAAPLTVRRKFGCLSSFFNFLVDMDHLRLNPARRLPLPKAEQAVPVCLTDEEVQQLVAAAVTPWGRCLVALLVCTGIRRSEAATICLEDIDLENRQLLINGKGAKQRVLPLNEMAVEAILQYLPHRGKGRIKNPKQLTTTRLFVSQFGDPIGPRVIGEMLERVLQKAGLADKGITPHRLRHTFATYLIRNGVDIRTVQELLGHSDLETTARYLHSDTRTKQAAVEKVHALLFSDAVFPDVSKSP